MMGGFNGKLCAQWVCSMGIYYGLNWKLFGVLNGNLGAQQGVMCSTGNYYVLNWTLLGCSTGSYVLNGKL